MSTQSTITNTEIPAGTWTVDPVHSSASFEVEHGGLSLFRAGFSEFTGSLVVDDETSRLEGVARVDSVDIDLPDLKGHLLSPEFFDAENHPEIRFTADDVRAEDGAVTVSGELALAGVSKPVQASGQLRGPAAGLGGDERISIALATVVDRTDYGFHWNMDLPGGGQALGNDVKLTVHLELVRG